MWKPVNQIRNKYLEGHRSWLICHVGVECSTISQSDTFYLRVKPPFEGWKWLKSKSGLNIFDATASIPSERLTSSSPCSADEDLWFVTNVWKQFWKRIWKLCLCSTHNPASRGGWLQIKGHYPPKSCDKLTQQSQKLRLSGSQWDLTSCQSGIRALEGERWVACSYFKAWRHRGSA